MILPKVLNSKTESHTFNCLQTHIMSSALGKFIGKACFSINLSAYNGIDDNRQRNVEVICSMRVEWLGELKPNISSTAKVDYATCEIIQPKFKSDLEYKSYENWTSIDLPVEFSKCQS